MYHQDISLSILNQLNDYETINHYCQLDQFHRHHCDIKFWINLFDRFGYNHPQPLPRTVDEWKRSFYAIYYTNDIIDKIHHDEKQEFDVISTDLNYFKKLLDKLYITTYRSFNENEFIKNIEIFYQPFYGYSYIPKKEYGLVLPMNSSTSYVYMNLEKLSYFCIIYYMITS